MNARQMAQQIQSVLETATWPGGAVVFGSRMVFLFGGVPTEDELPGSFPFALVNLGTGEADADDPNLLLQTFDVLTVSDVMGGRMGENALVGGAVSTLNTSANRGVLELNDRVRDALKDLSGADGAKLQLRATATGSPVILGNGRHMAIGESTFTGWVTAAPSYSHPTKLAVSGTTWTWEGSQCSSRYDFLQYRLGYVAGSEPVQSPDDLDVVVYTGTSPTTTHTPVAGQAYSVFADYNARGTSEVVEGSSDGRVVGAFLTS